MAKTSRDPPHNVGGPLRTWRGGKIRNVFIAFFLNTANDAGELFRETSKRFSKGPNFASCKIRSTNEHGKESQRG